MNDLRKEMGMRMKERRRKLQLTQEQMAERLNISVKHYGGVERGNAGLSLENLVEASRLLKVDLDYLVKGETDEKGELPHRIVEIYENSSHEKQERILEILEILDRFS